MTHSQLTMFGLNSYHATTGITDEKTLQEREVKARSTEALVLQLLKENPYASFTPYEAYLRLGQQKPEGSIRRAMTNLTDDGLLYVTGELRDGRYKGFENNCWRYKENQLTKY